VFTMSRLRFRAIKTSRKIKKSKAQPPIAPTISGKNEDCPLDSSTTCFSVGFVVVGGEVGSVKEKVTIIDSLEKSPATYLLFVPSR
jgi:hypothetical protein